MTAECHSDNFREMLEEIKARRDAGEDPREVLQELCDRKSQ